MVDLKSVSCPACGGLVDWNDEQTNIRCAYCGTLLQIDDGAGDNPSARILETLETSRDLTSSLLTLHGLQAEIREMGGRRRNWHGEQVFRQLRHEEEEKLRRIEELRNAAGLSSAAAQQVRIEPVRVPHETDDGRGILFAMAGFVFGGILVAPFMLVDRFLISIFNLSGSFIPFTMLGSLIYLGLCVFAFFYFRRSDHTIYSLILDAAEGVKRVLG